MDYFTAKDADKTPRKVAGRYIGDIFHQVHVPLQESRSDNFAAAGAGVTVDVSLIPCSRFAIQVKGTGGAPTAWEVVLEGSLNGVQFTTLITHKNGQDADGAIRAAALDAPMKYFRSRCVSITLGPATNAVATIVGEAR